MSAMDDIALRVIHHNLCGSLLRGREKIKPITTYSKVKTFLIESYQDAKFAAGFI